MVLTVWRIVVRCVAANVLDLIDVHYLVISVGLRRVYPSVLCRMVLVGLVVRGCCGCRRVLGLSLTVPRMALGLRLTYFVS